MAKPEYRFEFRIVDQSTGETVIADYCGLTSIDQFGGCESVDMHMASMLRAFQRTAKAEYEARDAASSEHAALAAGA